MTRESYSNLYESNPEGFELMTNSANALLLQFKEPLIYDLTIPSVGKIKRLMHIFQDGFDGNIIDPLRVNCCCPDYSDRNLKLDFEGKYPEKIEKGLQMCFNKKDKYDNFPIEIHLNANKEIFGNEGYLYRFREGAREKIETEVRAYFNKNELNAFEDIGRFIKPYVMNLDKSANSAY